MSDQERLDRLSAKAQQKAAEEARKLEEKVGGLRSQIERFLDEKGAIQRSPMTISETLKSAQKILAQRKQEFFVEGLLAQELKALQNQYSFLEPAAMRIHLLGDLHMFRWVFSNWIT